MTAFDPVTSAIGGALIGLSVALLMLLNGRIAGISGIVSDFLAPSSDGKGWRIAFILGLIAAPILSRMVGLALPTPQMPESWAVVIIGGLLVGFGARLSGGCTSGHGVCGIARLSPRSLAATAIFMGAAIVVVAIVRHGIGG